MTRMPADVPFRFLALLSAILIYGCFGSPTPQAFGMVEAVVGFLLMASVNPAVLLRRIGGHNMEREWMVPALLLLVYGLTIPLCTGILLANSPGLIMRDLIPFLFMFLPFFLISPGGFSSLHLKLLVATLVAAGLVFSMRVSLPPLLGMPTASDTGEGAKYLSISPLVLFSAMIMILYAGYLIYSRFTVMRIVAGLSLLALSIFPFMAMSMTIQRASLGLLVFLVCFVSIMALIRNPVRALGPVLVLGIAMLFFGWSMIPDIFETLFRKHALVGTNMRIQEMSAVLESVSGSVWTVVFGRGWGGVFVSPAVGETEVAYAHSLLTYFILKTGLAGLFLVTAWFALLLKAMIRAIRGNALLVVSISAPLFIDTVLYASYKSLDFGLILLLAGGLSSLGMVQDRGYGLQLRDQPSSCIP